MTVRARVVGGFTLIELLVVIGVVGVVVAALLPALSGGRGLALMLVGSSNIRQLQIANLTYADDHDGRFMPGAVDIETTQLVRWHGTRDGVGGAFTHEGGAITPYLDGRSSSADGGVRMCPVFAGMVAEGETGSGAFELGTGGYGYNNAFVGTDPGERIVGGERILDYQVAGARERGSRRSRFDRPSGTVAFADAAFAGNEGLIEYSFVEPRFWPQFVGDFRPDPSVHFRHVGGRANVAWLDGHVTREERTLTWSSGLYVHEAGPLGIGWFGDADTNGLFDYR